MSASGEVPRVLLVSPKPPPVHGAAMAVGALLGGCGDRVEWRHVDARYASEVSQLQKVRAGKIARLLRYLWQTASGSLRCDVVVLTPSFQRGTFLKDSLFVWLCWILRRRPLVAWYHMSFRTMNYDGRSRLFRWYARRTMRRIQHHVCVAQRLVPEMPDFVRPETVVALPNGSPSYPGREAVGGGGFKVLYLSHMGQAKGWGVLLEAAGQLCDQFADLEFLFYGPPAYETTAADLERAFGGGGHRDRIRYCGAADEGDKARLFREIDMLCFPSLNEAFPITILEAMSAGIPIVASDVGGIADALDHEKGGLLVPAGDPGALRRALEVALRDPERARRWGEYNRARYLELFTDEAFCTRWCEFLRKVA